MISPNSIKDRLGSDADLLMKSDEWLRHRAACILDDMQGHADELFAIYQAQRTKNEMRDDGLMAVMVLHRNNNNELNDVTINIVPENKAQEMVNGKCNDIYDAANRSAQYDVWKSDGRKI